MLNTLILGIYMKFKEGQIGWNHFLSNTSKIKNLNYSQSHLVKNKTKDCSPFLSFRQFCFGRSFKREPHLGNGLLKMGLSKKDGMLQRKEMSFYSQEHLVLIDKLYSHPILKNYYCNILG